MNDRSARSLAQIERVAEALKAALKDRLRAIYLHGSAVGGGLKPLSDLDLIALVDGSMTSAQRKELLAAMLRISVPYPAPAGGPRCIELFVFAAPDPDAPAAMPVAAEFVYGEWLREEFADGAPARPDKDHDNTLLLAMARQQSIALLGPPAERMLPEIDGADIREAMLELLPPLTAALEGDERNVLLTLARIWRTAAMGDFVPKDVAADWAVPQMPRSEAETMAYTRDAYRAMATEDWTTRQIAARRTASFLRRHIEALLR